MVFIKEATQFMRISIHSKEMATMLRYCTNIYHRLRGFFEYFKAKTNSRHVENIPRPKPKSTQLTQIFVPAKLKFLSLK